MDHSDWVGIAILVSTLTSSVIAILNTIQAIRNHQAIKQVETKVNGVVEAAVESAHKSGLLEGQAQQFRDWQKEHHRPAT